LIYEIIHHTFISTSCSAAVPELWTLGIMRVRNFHVFPWSLAAIYVAWSIYILLYGGDWAPIYLYFPLWPFSIGLEALIKTFPEGPSLFFEILECGIWVVGGIVWCLLVGYAVSWSVTRVARLFRRRGAS
jgi:hypothetical protein